MQFTIINNLSQNDFKNIAYLEFFSNQGFSPYISCNGTEQKLQRVMDKPQLVKKKTEGLIILQPCHQSTEILP